MKQPIRPAIFKWRQTAPEVILCAVRWYLRYSLSLRDVEELLDERGLKADHTTVWRWVQRYGPELEQRLRRHLKPTNKSWRVDETYVRVKGRWCYLYRAIDSTGATIDFLLSALRDAAAAKRLFRQALSDPSHPQPRVINTDQARHYGAEPAPPRAPRRRTRFEARAQSACATKRANLLVVVLWHDRPCQSPLTVAPADAGGARRVVARTRATACVFVPPIGRRRLSVPRPPGWPIAPDSTRVRNVAHESARGSRRARWPRSMAHDGPPASPVAHSTTAETPWPRRESRGPGGGERSSG